MRASASNSPARIAVTSSTATGSPWGRVNFAPPLSGVVIAPRLRPPRAQQRAQVVDRVGLLGLLVGPVALDPREAQREPAAIAGRGLHAVQGNLDDELGTDEQRDP